MSDDCIFCQIVNGEMDTELLYEDDKVVAFKDINPRAPIHFLIIPREHIPTILELNKKHNELVGHIYQVANELAEEYDIAEDGFRLVTNCNEDGGQVVFHIHFHLLGGAKLGDIC
ncbi:MAG: histidine triad nucleotide-binding protein [Halanaerobiales bacterium]